MASISNPNALEDSYTIPCGHFGPICSPFCCLARPIYEFMTYSGLAPFGTMSSRRRCLAGSAGRITAPNRPAAGAGFRVGGSNVVAVIISP